MTRGESINLAVAIIAAAAVVVAALQLRLGIRAQRRSSQPVVVAHQVGEELAPPGGGDALMGYKVHLKNHGIGTAFNVRFGVELAGARYPFTSEPDAERGARQIVEAGDRVPETDNFQIRVPAAPFLAGEGQARATSTFWARYENAFGETYETTNPADPTGNLIIERLKRRELKKREREETERRQEVEQEGQRIDEEFGAFLLGGQPDESE